MRDIEVFVKKGGVAVPDGTVKRGSFAVDRARRPDMAAPMFNQEAALSGQQSSRRYIGTPRNAKFQQFFGGKKID